MRVRTGVLALAALALATAALAGEIDPPVHGRPATAALMITNPTFVGYERIAFYPMGKAPLGRSDARWIMRHAVYPVAGNRVRISWAGSGDCPQSRAVVRNFAQLQMVSEPLTIDGGGLDLVWRKPTGDAETTTANRGGGGELDRATDAALSSLASCWKPSLKRVRP